MAGITSDVVLMRVSTVSFADIATNGKYIVCETASTAAASANVAERQTKQCGTIKTVTTPSVTISGSAVTAIDLTATQASAQDIFKWIDANTLIYFLYQNEASGTATAGEAIYLAGSGYFNSVSVTSDTGEVSSFDWEFAVSGTVDYVP